jgi:ParB family chromosome partitioning protein
MSRRIPVRLIDPDPEQPRQRFDEDALEELAQSLAQDDLIQPIMVRPVGERYVIVHGERRWRAAVRLGWDAIPAEVRDLDAGEARWVALVENVQREDLNPIEEALAYQRHLETGITQQDLARRIGKSQPHVSHKLRLLTLPAEVQQALIEKGITEGHARQLLMVDDPDLQRQMCQRAVVEGWSVRRIGEELDIRTIFGPAFCDALEGICPGVRLTRTGLEFPDGTTQEQWRKVGAMLGAVMRLTEGG